MPTVYSTDGHIRLTPVSDDGTTLTWSAADNFGFNYNYVDNNDDGDTDVGGDEFSGIELFTGYLIDIGGKDYGVFSDGLGYYYVPYFDGDSLDGLIPASGSTSTKGDNIVLANCFFEGTLISTPLGKYKVEELAIGDLVQTEIGQAVPVKWIGRQLVRPALANAALDEVSTPVRIAAGTFGNDVPHTDLTVSADHGMVLGGHVINASALVNGTTIRFVPGAELPREFTYYHVETEAHDVILANGAPAETFIDCVTRSKFDNYQEYLDLYGAERIIPEMPMPRISSQRLLPASLRKMLGIGTEAGPAALAG